MDTHHPSQSQSAAAIQAGEEALARGAWDEARSAFERALQADESPEALECLGMAAWWLDDATTTFDVRNRAYRLYRERGDQRGAARVAICLAQDHYSFRGEYAVTNGWIQRAHRLLKGLDPVPEHGWLAVLEADVALTINHDTATAQRLSSEAAALGRELQDIDLEMLALALEGLALVTEGAIDDGMRRLDEATTAAVSGEMTDLDATVSACCCLIYACERVRDYDRAAQWCERVKEISARSSFRSMFAFCQAHYAGILMWRGAWVEAEAELDAATHQLQASRPAHAAEGIVRLAELRYRQGRFDEAAAHLDRAESHPFRMLTGNATLLGRASMALDRNDPATAVELADRFTRGLPSRDRTERAAGLELLVRAHAALGDIEQAKAPLAELQSLASDIATPPLRASASFAEGTVAAAAGEHETARRHLEDALDLFERSGAPFETARARLELARCLCALGRCAIAEQEARAALNSLQEIGAAREAERAAALLRELEIAARGRTSEVTNLAGLTRRELEILRLVAQGLSNGEIAARLVLSEHTVHRHVANILTKLDLPSRAAAVAYAARRGLL